eukprot:3686257-Rhodomonas_salina.1
MVGSGVLYDPRSGFVPAVSINPSISTKQRPSLPVGYTTPVSSSLTRFVAPQPAKIPLEG